MKVEKAVVIHHPNMTMENEGLNKILSILSNLNVEILVYAADSVHGHEAHISSFMFTLSSTLFIAYGGDGTFATAARLAADTVAPVMGIQAGNVNFLNAFTIDNFAQYLGAENTDHKFSNRYSGAIGGSCPGETDFINDVVFRSNSVDTFHIRDEQDRYLTSFRGDGVVIATAMGSTAYNLSLGGPIIHPTLAVFTITPIAPMTLGSRPIVVPMQQLTVEIEQSKSGRSFMDVHYDGLGFGLHESCVVGLGHAIPVILPPEHNFYTHTRDKLGWYK